MRTPLTTEFPPHIVALSLVHVLNAVHSAAPPAPAKKDYRGTVSQHTSTFHPPLILIIVNIICVLMGEGVGVSLIQKEVLYV